MKTAIIKASGRQYMVREGDIVRLDIASNKIEDTVEIGEVLAIKEDGEFEIGKPFIKGCKVICEVKGKGKAKKIIVFKKKAKKNYRVKRGHRQKYVEVLVKEIKKGE